MGNEVVIKGKIISGTKKGAYFTQLDWVRKQCKEKLGFIPYPGTLNLQVSDDVLATINKLERENCKKLIPPDPQFCEAKIFSILIGQIQGALILPAQEVRVHKRNIIEILSHINLREEFDLKDGDILSFKVVI